MRNVYGWSLVLVAGLATAAWAQRTKEDERVPARPDRTGRAVEGQVVPGERPGAAVPGRPALVDRGGANTNDQQLAAVIFASCRNHIELAKFAQDKLQNEEARQFAEKMVRDHTPGCDKMKQLAGNLVMATDEGPGIRATPGARPGAAPGAAPPARPGARPAPRPDDGAAAEPPAETPAEARREAREERREERREARGAAPGVEVEVQPGDRPGLAIRAGQAGQLNWVAIHQQIADQCLNTLKQQFEEHQGKDFDMAYMAYECMVHLKTIDELSVLKNHASPELRADLDKSIAMAKEHLEEAKQIKKSLKGEEGEPRLSRKPKETTPTPSPLPRRKEE